MNSLEQKHIEGIISQGILPLFYNANASTCISITQCLYGAGIRYVEFTNRGPEALSNFGQLVRAKSSLFPEMVLGIGTVKTADDARAYVDAGADFLVSPVFDNGVNDVAYLNKMLWIPGCMTPTDIHVAQRAGCSFIKLFPGNVLQPGYIQAILPLFNGVKFMVTGGVEPTKESVASWLKAGASAVGMGSKLIAAGSYSDEQLNKLASDTKALLAIIAEIRN